jgi:hypothetical protein
MRNWPYTLLLAFSVFAFCGTAQTVAVQSRPLTPERAAAVEDGVRAFTRTVAHDVTEEGPAAWHTHFADIPSFFMAVDGRLVYPNGAAAMAAIPDLVRNIKHIELRWGDDLRVDPLTADLAVVATSWHEVIVNATGKRVEETGFFTGVVQYRDSSWEFRNAHWSVAVPAASIP